MTWAYHLHHNLPHNHYDLICITITIMKSSHDTAWKACMTWDRRLHHNPPHHHQHHGLIIIMTSRFKESCNDIAWNDYMTRDRHLHHNPNLSSSLWHCDIKKSSNDWTLENAWMKVEILSLYCIVLYLCLLSADHGTKEMSTIHFICLLLYSNAIFSPGNSKIERQFNLQNNCLATEWHQL